VRGSFFVLVFFWALVRCPEQKDDGGQEKSNYFKED
jgi:hypothetical protein